MKNFSYISSSLSTTRVGSWDAREGNEAAPLEMTLWTVEMKFIWWWVSKVVLLMDWVRKSWRESIRVRTVSRLWSGTLGSGSSGVAAS